MGWIRRNPIDVTPQTAVSNSSVTSITVPGVTTSVPGAMLIGGIGADGSTATTTQPSGWSEAWENSGGGQIAELAYKAAPTAGASGAATWTLSQGRAVAGWMSALRPAGGAGGGGPSRPVASFTASPLSGSAPLAVSFTDTSSGSPTSWSWSFGDGGTSTAQNPSHTYTLAGTYQATVTATNAAGSSTATPRTITVTSSGPSQPVASFTASPLSGTAPLAVSFTDTSSGSPTSWSWSFGDGGSSTAQNPTHTYTSAGTYQATVTATNAAGSSTATPRTITVNASTGGGSVTAGSSTVTRSAKTTAVSLSKPAGVATDDVLVAAVTADNKPTISAPAGWTALLPPPTLSPAGGATLFVYYHVVSNAGAEPSSYQWTLSSAQKWGGGVTVFRGVDTANPIDVAPQTAVSNSSVTSITVPGVTTSRPGAMLIGGVGADGSTATTTQPSGWSEAWENTGGGQIAELAYKAAPTAGASGAGTWTLSQGRALAGWMSALRPAA